jgi:hypothetical protein
VKLLKPAEVLFEPSILQQAIQSRQKSSDKYYPFVIMEEWGNGRESRHNARLKFDGRQREGIPKSIMDLGAKCDMVFRRQWLEEFNMSLDRNNVNLDYYRPCLFLVTRLNELA